MQTRPDHPTLLEAVAEFLLAEIGPQLESNKALQFRVLIAANLTTIVAQELRTEPDRIASEAERLATLLPDQPKATTAHALDALNKLLAKRLREGSIPLDAAADQLLAIATETIAVTNPRFDTSEEVGP